MTEVSGKTLALFRKISERTGVAVEEIFHGTVCPPVDGADPEYIPWSEFCILCRNASRACGGVERLADMGAEVIELPEVGRIVGVISLFASAHTLYWANKKFSGPAMFNHLGNELEQLPNGLLSFTITIPDDYEDCPEFFYLNSGVLKTVPRLIGLREAFIELELARNKCTYIIEAPPSMTLWARIRRAFSVLFFARTALEEISAQQSLLANRYKELQATREDLERARDEALASKMAAEQALAVKSQFLATMSHELRTPLNGVLGMTQILMTTSLDDEQKRYTETIYDCGQNLLTLISDVLDFSKIEAAKLELRATPFDVVTVVERVLGMLAKQAQDQRTELGADFGDAPRMIVSDPLRIQQVLLNLIGNAVKFTSDGEVFVRLEVAEQTGDELVLRFCIRDTGIGIPEAFIPKLFMPFTQVDSSNTRSYGGTGLGLAISKEIVTRLGGHIDVASELGQGTTFTFTIRTSVATPTTSETVPRPELAQLGAYTALVVDDNATNRTVVRQCLVSWGLAVETAGNGRQALAALANKRFDIVLLDLRMPDMDGFELAQELRRQPAHQQTQVLILTASGDRGDAQRATELGIAGYLTKPFRHAQLHATVERLLKRPRPDEATPKAQPGTDSRGTLMVVDDNRINRHFAIRAFERLGYRVVGASSGHEAIALAQKQRFDLIFMDCEMPLMNGFDATRALRKIEATAAIPIVALTAHTNDEVREQCSAAGMDDYIAKPPTLETLAQTLTRWLH